MLIDDFKQELVMILYSYLRFHHKQVEFTIAIPQQNVAPTKVMLSLIEGKANWSIEKLATSITPSPSKLKHSELITDLLNIILFEEQGYTLHSTLDLYLDKFPKWLALSSRIPLRNHLYEALKKFPKDKLQENEEQSKKLMIKMLTEKNSQLSSELERVNAYNKLLTEENQRCIQGIATQEQIIINNSSLQHQVDIAINEYQALFAQLAQEKQHYKIFQETSVSQAKQIELLQMELQALKQQQIKPKKSAEVLPNSKPVQVSPIASQHSRVEVEALKKRDALTRSRSYNALPVSTRWGSWLSFYKRDKPDSLRNSIQESGAKPESLELI